VIAAQRGYIDILQMLQPLPHRPQKWNMECCLARACSGNIELVEALLDCGINPSLEYTYPSRRPLNMAIQGQNSDIIRLLVNRGLDLNASSYDVVYRAAYAAKPWVLVLLLELGAKPDKGADADYLSLLHVAVAANNITNVEALLNYGIPVDIRRNGNGATALYWANVVGAILT
jgi:ankyrin repeat protein